MRLGSPLQAQISEKYGLIYVVTKLGLLFVYDLETATAVYRNRISPDPIFLACESTATGGIYAVNRCVPYAVRHAHRAARLSRSHHAQRQRGMKPLWSITGRQAVRDDALSYLVIGACDAMQSRASC